MNILQALATGLDKLYPRLTQSEIEAKLLAANEQTVQECEKVINDHEFTKFMANAQSEAIIAWRNLKKEERNGT